MAILVGCPSGFQSWFGLRASNAGSTAQARVAEEAGECSGYERELWGLAVWAQSPLCHLVAVHHEKWPHLSGPVSFLVK